jgi:hypothetical protein
MTQHREVRPFTIVTTITVLAKNKNAARKLAKQIRDLLHTQVRSKGVLPIPETLRSDIEEKLEIYEQDFRKESV